MYSLASEKIDSTVIPHPYPAVLPWGYGYSPIAIPLQNLSGLPFFILQRHCTDSL